MMNRKVLILASVLFGVMLNSFTVCAFEDALQNDQLYSNVEVNLDEDVISVLESLGFEDFSPEEFCNISLQDTFRMISDLFKGSLKKPFSYMSLFVGVLIICAFAHVYLREKQNMSGFFDSLVTMFFGLISLSVAANVISDTVSSMYSAGVLMKSLIPVTAVMVAISGTPSMAFSYNSVAMYCAQIISAICRDFLTPVVNVFSAVAVCASVNQPFNSESILSAVKRVINIVLGLLGTVFTGVIALKDVLAVGIDKVAIKGVKFLLGSSVPVIGSALSEGLSSVLASVALMKNTYGTIGIIVVVCTTLPAVCELILWQIVFSVTGYVAQAFSLNSVSKVFLSLQYVMSVLLSILLFVIYILVVISAVVMLLGSK